MSQSSNRPSIPKSVRHKRILDLAADNPEASVDDLAADVPSATPELVERVLDEYGDPAAEEDPIPDAAEASPPTESGTLNLEGLTDKQQEVIHAIAEHPEASQSELADLLDVSAPTISNRANSIEGFTWADRQKLVESVDLTDAPMHENETPETTNEERNGTEPETTSPELTERVTALEQEVDALADDSGLVGENPSLAHKVAHACMDSEVITEDEELQIFEALLS